MPTPIVSEPATVRPAIHMTGDTPRARYSDPITSHMGADDSAKTRELVEEHVLHLFQRAGEHGLTDRELTRSYFSDVMDGLAPEVDVETPRKRRSDLARKGHVIATTMTRKGVRSQQTVWVIA